MTTVKHFPSCSQLAHKHKGYNVTLLPIECRNRYGNPYCVKQDIWNVIGKKTLRYVWGYTRLISKYLQISQYWLFIWSNINRYSPQRNSSWKLWLKCSNSHQGWVGSLSTLRQVTKGPRTNTLKPPQAFLPFNSEASTLLEWKASDQLFTLSLHSFSLVL